MGNAGHVPGVGTGQRECGAHLPCGTAGAGCVHLVGGGIPRPILRSSKPQPYFNQQGPRNECRRPPNPGSKPAPRPPGYCWGQPWPLLGGARPAVSTPVRRRAGTHQSMPSLVRPHCTLRALITATGAETVTADLTFGAVTWDITVTCHVGLARLFGTRSRTRRLRRHASSCGTLQRESETCLVVAGSAPHAHSRRGAAMNTDASQCAAGRDDHKPPAGRAKHAAASANLASDGRAPSC